MRRIWIAALVALCLGLACATALAAPPAATYRDEPGTAMFFVYWAGAWDEVQMVDGTPTLVSHEAGDAVPCGYRVMVDSLWIGQGYGQVSTLPANDQLKLSLSRDGKTFLAQSWADGRASWSPVFVMDEYWETLFGGPFPPFNPRMGTDAYGVKWEQTFTQEFLGGEGTVHVTVDENLRHVVNDLSMWDPSWRRPTKLLPGLATYEFDIELQGCPTS